jgi:hypothetical protein
MNKNTNDMLQNTVYFMKFLLIYLSVCVLSSSNNLNEIA